MGSVFQTAEGKEKDVFPGCFHFDPIDIARSDIEEAPDILKNVNEDQFELIQCLFDTLPVIEKLLGVLVGGLLVER